MLALQLKCCGQHFQVRILVNIYQYFQKWLEINCSGFTQEDSLNSSMKCAIQYVEWDLNNCKFGLAQDASWSGLQVAIGNSCLVAC